MITVLQKEGQKLTPAACTKYKIALEKKVQNHEIIYRGPATKLTAPDAKVMNPVLVLMVSRADM